MTNKQFNLLALIDEYQKYDEQNFARILFEDEDSINLNYKALVLESYVKDGIITKKGQSELKKHSIDNALILAAGTSSRFVPLNFEKPKGLLEVKGEVLIERQIRQLHEKGITSIFIVVGYMKEQFEYLTKKYGVQLIESTDYATRNNHASVYAARDILKNTIITSSDLYFVHNIFQKYAFDSYYCTVFMTGKTAERGIETDEDNKILKTMYGDKCFDIWVTLGYAFFSDKFSKAIIDIISKEFDTEEIKGKFWADIQDDHLEELYMYAKKCEKSDIQEFDSLEELRAFDSQYSENSQSKIMLELCNMLGVQESSIIALQSLKKIKSTLFMFRCKGDTYICDVKPNEQEKITYQGRVFYQYNDITDRIIKLYIMDKNIRFNGMIQVDTDKEIKQLIDLSKDFKEYHDRALPLCAAENVISPFVNIPLGYGFQERYIMNNTYSFNMDDNFIGCEKLFPFYQKISEVCTRVFGAKYTDPRPFTGMHCIDMITKTVCKPGEKMMILDKAHGGHASVKPVVERLGIKTYPAPYNVDEFDLDYDTLNAFVRQKGINYILLAPSDLIKPLCVERIDTTNCVLLYDCSQVMGLIAGGLCPNPLRSMKNIIMFGGTHKTFPGPASGLILTNEKYLHDLMETEINPKYLRHSQMHQKISLLFALVEFEKYGAAYMSHMVHCSNYIGRALKNLGYDVADCHGQISSTHQIFIRCSKDTMDTIYDNAFKCEVTLNKKHKDLFIGYGVRLGIQEIARYDWNDQALNIIAQIVYMLADKNVNVEKVKVLKKKLPEKKVHYTFPDDIISNFTL